MTKSHFHRAVFASRLQPQDTKGSRHNHPLLTVVWWRDTFKEFKAVEGGSTTGGLVGDHTTDSFEENL